jgi:hypothetical protein
VFLSFIVSMLIDWALSDVIEALTLGRTYHTAIGKKKSVAVIRNQVKKAISLAPSHD